MSKTIEFAIGAALLSHLLLGLLWLGWASGWLAAALLVFSLALWVWLGPWRRPKLGVADLVFAPFVILYLIHALAPPTAPDAIGYHLGLTVEWLRTGSLARTSAGIYDAMPHGLETLFLAATALGGLTAATLLHFTFLLATLPLIVAVAARLGFDGRPAALLYFTAPVVGMAGASAYVDAAAGFYALATFWLLLESQYTRAGLTAGFCYAVKMSGGLVTLAAGVYLLARRSWAGLAFSAAMVLPWLAHSWWLTDNPVAPMLPTVFPSPAFHVDQLAAWVDYVRSYGVPWDERWWEITLGGERAQGLLGPGFLLAPVGLLALRRRSSHRWLLIAAAIVSGAGWFLNVGTRFLIPAAIFVALAVMSVLPRRIGWVLAIAHAVLCWPAVLDRYVPAAAWRLPTQLPWRAALRLEPEADYLARIKPETLTAAMVKRHVKPGERILDLGEAPRAYAGGAELLSGWQYTASRRALAAILMAHSDARRQFVKLSSHWPRRRLRTLRLELLAASPDPWSVQELRLLRGAEVVFPSRAWELDANPNPWEAPLAFDRNRTSGWRTGLERRAGMYLGITGSIDSDGLELICPFGEALPVIRVTAVDEQGGAVELSGRLEVDSVAPEPRLNLRREAMRYVRHEGFQWILAYRPVNDNAWLSRALADYAPDWGLEKVDEVNGAVLSRLPN